MKKLLVFTAKWCGSCKMIKPILHKLADENLINLQIVDIDEQRAHAKQMEVKSIPVSFFYNDDVVYEKVVGFMPREKILEIYNRKMEDSLGEDLEVDIVAEYSKPNEPSQPGCDIEEKAEVTEPVIEPLESDPLV